MFSLKFYTRMQLLGLLSTFWIGSIECNTLSVYKGVSMDGLGKVWNNFVYETIEAKGLIECGAICSAKPFCDIFAPHEFAPETKVIRSTRYEIL